MSARIHVCGLSASNRRSRVFICRQCSAICFFKPDKETIAPSNDVRYTFALPSYDIESSLRVNTAQVEPLRRAPHSFSPTPRQLSSLRCCSASPLAMRFDRRGDGQLAALLSCRSRGLAPSSGAHIGCGDVLMPASRDRHGCRQRPGPRLRRVPGQARRAGAGERSVTTGRRPGGRVHRWGQQCHGQLRQRRARGQDR